MYVEQIYPKPEEIVSYVEARYTLNENGEERCLEI